MKKLICLVIAILMLSSTLVFANTVDFTDVKSNDWFHDAVIAMADKGIIKGVVTNGVSQFKPNDNMTKIEFIAVVSRLLWPEEAVNSTKQGEQWWETINQVAKSHSLFTSAVFSHENMENNIKIEEMSEIIINAARALGEEIPANTDNISVADLSSVSEGFKLLVKQAYALGFLSGVDSNGNFAPSNNVKRCEAATVIYRLIDKSKRVNTTQPTNSSSALTSTVGANGLTYLSVGNTYDQVGPIGEDLFLVIKDGMSGIINLKGELILPCEYEEIYCFADGLAMVCKNGLYGAVDKTGKLVIPTQYEDMNEFSQGLAPVRKDEKWGFIDKTNKLVIDYKYDGVTIFSEDLAAVSLGGKCGYIDKTGKTVLDFIYESASIFKEGYAEVHYYTPEYLEHAKQLDSYELSEEDQYFMIDKKGNLVFTINYTSGMGGFSEGLSSYSYYGEMMYLNTKFETAIANLAYGNLGDFHNGLATVISADGVYGYIDKTGKVAIDCKYTSADDFLGNYARVYYYDDATETEVTGVIDKTGKEIVPVEYDDSYNVVGGYVTVQKDGNWFIVILK